MKARAIKKKSRPRRHESESSDSNSESKTDQAKQRQPRPALQYRVTHIKEVTSEPQLLWTRLPVCEAANGKIDMLYDSTISLVKLRQLKDDALIYENKIALTGITGHKVYTIGKTYATIELGGRRLKHAFCVIGDDTPIEHEGILEIDFLRKHTVTCDYSNRRLQIGNTVLKLHPFSKLILKPRSEIVLKATTNKNRVGIVRAEEMTPGVYLGNCLVNAEEYECFVSVINTTDKTVEIASPYVTIEEIEPDTSATMHTYK